MSEITSEMKAACMGEFSFAIELICSACHVNGPEPDCETCFGGVEYGHKVTVPWTTVKDIYRAMLKAAPEQRNAPSSTIWIAGASADDKAMWLRGIYSTEQAAAAVCEQEDHFIGPWEVDKPVPDGLNIWPGAYYPVAKQDGGEKA